MLAAQNDDIVPIKPQKVHVEVLDWQDLNIINRRETILVDSLGTASLRVLGNGQHFSSTLTQFNFCGKHVQQRVQDRYTIPKGFSYAFPKNGKL